VPRASAVKAGRRLPRRSRSAAGLGIALVAGAATAATLAVTLHEGVRPSASAATGSPSAAAPDMTSGTPSPAWPSKPPRTLGPSPPPATAPANDLGPVSLSAGPCSAPLTFVDGLHGWMTVPTGGTTSEILATSNGGVSWNPQLSVPFWVGTLDFVDVDDGWALAGPSETPAPEAGGLLRTTDGGATWAAAGQPGQPLVCIDFVSPAAGFGLTEAGGLVTTGDGGMTWSPLSVGASLAVEAVCFGDPSQGWAVAGTTIGAPVGIYGTADGGAAWNLEYTAPWLGSFAPASLAITCAGPAVWVMVPLGVGAGNEYTEYVRTSDGGAQWTPSPSPTPTGEDVDDMDGPVAIVGGGTVLIASAGGPAPPVLETVAGGGSISAPIRFPVPSGVPYEGDGDSAAGMSFVDPLHGWVLISAWLGSDPAATADLAASQGTILTGGGGGFLDALYATTDGGQTWSLQATYTYDIPTPSASTS